MMKCHLRPELESWYNIGIWTLAAPPLIDLFPVWMVTYSPDTS